MATVTTQLNSSTPLSVPSGGTGLSATTTAYAPVCAGTTATGNLQNASTGISEAGSILLSNGSSAVPSFQVGNIRIARLTLSTANIQNMYATPIQVIAAQGAHTFIMVYGGVFEYIFNTTAFGGGDSTLGPALQYGSSGSGVGFFCVSSQLDLSLSASNIAFSNPDDSNGFDGVTITTVSSAINQGLYVSNRVGAYTGGGSSTIQLTVYYDVLTTTS